MGGGPFTNDGGAKKSFQPVSFDPGDMKWFMNSDVPGITQSDKMKLSNAGQFVTASNGRELNRSGYMTADGQNLDAIVNAFNNFNKNRSQGSLDEQAYLKLATASPGRSATILTDQSQMQQTVLGRQGGYGSTVLG